MAQVSLALQHCGGRKFILAVVALASISFMLLHGDITAIIYRDLVIATVGTYIAGNVSQKIFDEGQS